jgi:hypothetical protein
VKTPRKLSLISVHDYGRETHAAYYEIVVDGETFDWVARIYSRKEELHAIVDKIIQADPEAGLPEQRYKARERVGNVIHVEKKGTAASEEKARAASQAWVREAMREHRHKPKDAGTLMSLALPLPWPMLPSFADLKRGLREFVLMALAYTTTTRNNMLQQIIDAMDAGAGAALWRIYDGARPASGGAATTLLAELTCSDPSATKAAGVLTFSAITSDASANATGTATWMRIVDSTGTFAVDGSVNTAGSDLNLNSTSITIAQQVDITSATITEGNP